MWGAIETRGGLVRQLIASKGVWPTLASRRTVQPLCVINNQGFDSAVLIPRVEYF